ncbi:GNAT family N-acetyltransferase [Pseudoalteromonas piratica]|uniref:GNAT family N-acetyltransferase n=1 Tax=Pseudoalteromonas piratica TaxID=1348114 RepID=UPI0009DEBB40|nr:GNAT family N-acetyltransferase [Pseudoalteromonas piratica]
MNTLIETPRMLMRQFTLEDAEQVFKFSSNEDVTRYTGDAGWVNTINDAENIIRNIWLKEYNEIGYARFAIILKENNQVIGFCGLKYEPELNAPDIGYRMLPEYWGKGLGMEASRAALEYAFNQLGLSYIVGEVDVANTASHKILTNLGLVEQKRYEKWGHHLIHLSIDNFPEITSDKFTLVEQTQAQAEAVFHLFSSSKVCEFYDLPTMKSLAEAKTLIEQDELIRRQGNGHRWLIQCNSHKQIVGSCGYKYDFAIRTAKISIEIHPDFWQQGFASSAITTMTKWMFTHIASLNRIEAEVLPENTASSMLFTKLGFHLDGVMREKGVWKNKTHDLQVFSQLRREI